MTKPSFEEKAWGLLLHYVEQSIKEVGHVSPIIFLWTSAGVIPLREEDPSDTRRMTHLLTVARLLARAYNTGIVGMAAETMMRENSVLDSSITNVSGNGFQRCVSVEIQTFHQQRTADFGISLDLCGNFRGLKMLEPATAREFARILPLHPVSAVERRTAMRTVKKLGAVPKRWFATGPEFGNS